VLAATYEYFLVDRIRIFLILPLAITIETYVLPLALTDSEMAYLPRLWLEKMVISIPKPLDRKVQIQQEGVCYVSLFPAHCFPLT
jgi:hypothetical protein